jgi:hypothetical protein
LTHGSVQRYGEVFRHSPKMQALGTVVTRVAAVSTPCSSAARAASAKRSLPKRSIAYPRDPLSRSSS